jgi:low affinity Fe/Cu permease
LGPLTAKPRAPQSRSEQFEATAVNTGFARPRIILMAKRSSRPKASVVSSSAHPVQEWFGHFARVASTIAGKPIAFLIAVAVVVAWAVTGPLFGFSDTWQLVINTGTTIVTFLMVFLIQNTQNRDQLAMQIKLAELIVAMKGAHNDLALAEEMSEEDLEKLHAHYQSMCEQTHESLTVRRSKLQTAASKDEADKPKKDKKAA